MKLQTLLREVDIDKVGIYTGKDREAIREISIGEIEREISDIIYDSRKVISDCIFVALSGVRNDGHDYLSDVAEKGAVVLVVENREKTEAILVVSEPDKHY